MLLNFNGYIVVLYCFHLVALSIQNNLTNELTPDSDLKENNYLKVAPKRNRSIIPGGIYPYSDLDEDNYLKVAPKRNRSIIPGVIYSYSDLDENNYLKVAPKRNRSIINHRIRPQSIFRGHGMHSYTFLRPVDCEELLQLGYTTNGVYKIWPKSRISDGKVLQVYCDMKTDKGGWTVLQRRGDFLRPIDYFYKDWKSYKRGFGDIERDFWLGNDNVFELTNQRLYSVRFDLTDVKGNHRYALYDIFFIDDEDKNYTLTIQDYSGTANDSMIFSHNGQQFSTKDRDNDGDENISCAVTYKGAWWYSKCHSSNLNGLYYKGKHKSYADGVNWSKWKGYHDSLYKTEIKIRPKNFRKNLI